MNNQLNKTSKFLSYILRHQPETIGITLDTEGWVDINILILQANQHGESLTKELIEEVVKTSDKRRFTISEDGLKIRAAQGHSTQQVKIKYVEQVPPEFLYHGTATRFIDSIKKQGLIAGDRHYVHLSINEQTANTVGKRHGKSIVLKVKALLMHQQGFKFYLADNGVWLTNNVHTDFLIFD
ncbi:RNA 2'-phosphotransferase [Gilliamella sp. ESL0250]|uniref:RNA 2'-phosphotransferase n=1 Tax=Gilliamella sp. ESL0250 TaxID=2705036 RepID=UPI00158000B1|nr:RNA 2'-phosphotransferase [Gilliamella sp. ESL0250]NUF50312.1 RNA 2'-phosphotransferase [Gilliamella sp. ESL0250]